MWSDRAAIKWGMPGSEFDEKLALLLIDIDDDDDEDEAFLATLPENNEMKSEIENEGDETIVNIASLSTGNSPVEYISGANGLAELESNPKLVCN